MPAFANGPDESKARFRDGIEEASASRASGEHIKSIQHAGDEENYNRNSKHRVLAVTKSSDDSDGQPNNWQPCSDSLETENSA